MNAKIIDFPTEELWATCPECDGQEWHLIVAQDLTVLGIECVNDECEWRYVWGESKAGQG